MLYITFLLVLHTPGTLKKEFMPMQLHATLANKQTDSILTYIGAVL